MKNSAPASCSPFPWRVDYGETVRILDANGRMISLMSHVHLTGRRSPAEVRANAELIVSMVNEN